MVGKEFLAFPSHLKSRRSPQERREELQYQAPFPESPRCLSPFQGNLFPCTASTFKPRMDSHCDGTLDSPVGKPRGKASRERLVGKSRGKASRESLVGKPPGKAPDPLILAKGSVTLLLQLGRKLTSMPRLETRTDSSGETPEVPQDPCQHWRGILRIRHRIHTTS